MSPADRAVWTARRKAIYIELHPETKHGENQYTRGEENFSTPSFAKDTAEKTGQTDRIVRMHAERGEKVIEEAINLIRGTKLDTGTYLDKLKGLRPNEQVTAAKRDLSHLRQQERERAARGGIGWRIVKVTPEPPPTSCDLAMLREDCYGYLKGETWIVGGLLLLCFIVGATFLMLFSKEGRGCIGGAIGFVLIVAAIIVLGAVILLGAGAALFSLLR